MSHYKSGYDWNDDLGGDPRDMPEEYFDDGPHKFQDPAPYRGARRHLLSGKNNTLARLNDYPRIAKRSKKPKKFRRSSGLALTVMWWVVIAGLVYWWLVGG